MRREEEQLPLNDLQRDISGVLHVLSGGVMEAPPELQGNISTWYELGVQTHMKLSSSTVTCGPSELNWASKSWKVNSTRQTVELDLVTSGSFRKVDRDLLIDLIDYGVILL